MDTLWIILKDIFNQICTDQISNDVMSIVVNAIIEIIVQHLCKFIDGNITGLLT